MSTEAIVATVYLVLAAVSYVPMVALACGANSKRFGDVWLKLVLCALAWPFFALLLVGALLKQRS